MHASGEISPSQERATEKLQELLQGTERCLSFNQAGQGGHSTHPE